jgi:hypothetical protein
MYKNKNANPKNKRAYSSRRIEESEDKTKYISIGPKGKEQKVKYDFFKYVKNLDKQKLQATRDSMIQMMKRKVEFHKNLQEVYNIPKLTKISEEREIELRDTVMNLQNEIRKERKREKSEIEFLYKTLLFEIHKIHEKISIEIDSRKSELMDRIMLSIANCNYKQNVLLDAKIKEQEEFFRNLHMFTFEMQQIKDNFNESIQKIKNFTENNYDLKKNIIQEKLKFYHITTVMKEFKKRKNYMLDKIIEYKTATHRGSKFNENYSNINNIYNKNKKNELMIDINNYIATTGNKITNYTEYITNNSNKTEANIPKIQENNCVFRERNFELNIINNLKQNIEMWKKKLVILMNRYKKVIPENEIYDSLIEIIYALKKDKTNKFFGNIEDEKLIDNMMTLPVQNKQFRKIFLELLFRNKSIFEAVRKGQKNELDKYFNRNLVWAQKIKNK